MISAHSDGSFVIDIDHSKTNRVMRHAILATVSVAGVYWFNAIFIGYLFVLGNLAAYLNLDNPSDDAVLDVVAGSAPKSHAFSKLTVACGIGLGLLLLAIDVWRYW